MSCNGISNCEFMSVSKLKLSDDTKVLVLSMTVKKLINAPQPHSQGEAVVSEYIKQEYLFLEALGCRKDIPLQLRCIIFSKRCYLLF